MIKQFKFPVIFLAAGHGINDLIAGYFLGSLAQQQGMDMARAGAGFVIYNLLAFGGQYPVALWLRRSAQPKKYLLLAGGLNVASLICFGFLPAVAVIFTGIASAVYHVAGGAICIDENKAASVGLFAAPGVAGLILGGYLAYHHYDITLILLLVAVLFFGSLFRLPIRVKKELPVKMESNPTRFHLEAHDFIMILLLAVISLRSAIWNIFQALHDKDYHWLLAIAIAASLGKIIGGWLADKIGWRLYAMSSLILATPLLTLFKKEWILFCIGIGLLQSGIPATTSLLIRSMKGEKEKAISLAFGLAVILGAFVLYQPLLAVFSSTYFLVAVSMLILLLLWWGRSKPADLMRP